MASNIIAAIRHAPQLKANLKFSAQEIGHRMNAQGYGHISYSFMSYKTGYSRRTCIRHIRQLVAMGIFAKTIYRTANGYMVNLYRCLLPIPAFYRASPATTHGDSVTPTLPETRRTEAKELSLRQEIAQLRKGMRLWREGSEQYNACLEKLQVLEARAG